MTALHVSHLNSSQSHARVKIVIRGAVQGVGFRPFVFRLATELQLSGWVSNTTQGVFIEAEGEKDVLDSFILRLEQERPPRAFIQSLEFSFLDPVGYSSFVIKPSDESGARTALVMADIATCPDCLREVFDPSNRRFLYPFTNCTNCGPRFSIIEALPYDRPNTSMKIFAMCPACRREYDDPLDRRFHAQPNACPACGPHVELWDETGGFLQSDAQALAGALQAIQTGRVVAVKGLGGFHLVVDARNEEAVVRLREKKHREEKPLALMFPSLESVESVCHLSDLERRLLLSTESPIALLERSTKDASRGPLPSSFSIAPSVAPRNPYLGVMLPYTPLHHILMRELGFPIVATSGNLSDEPICIDEREAVNRLAGIADCFLVHNRPIVRHVDDSIVRVMMGREMVVRRARGYAPLPVTVDLPSEVRALAVGAHLKNSVALAVGSNAFISQHIGDLETEESLVAFRRVVKDLQQLYDVRPEYVVCDMHPEYLSSKDARGMGSPVYEVQHHYAHIASCMAENELDGGVLGVSWDGTGFGLDGTIWGGEFLLTRDGSFERVATFRQFRLPGGERAIKEPRRTAVGALYELFGDQLFGQEDLVSLRAFESAEIDILRRMLQKGVNSPVTSSVGRLFDAVASIIGLRQFVTFEGQAAMELEFTLQGDRTNDRYAVSVSGQPHSDLEGKAPPMLLVDWGPGIRELVEDVRRATPPSRIAAKFHNMLVHAIVEVAQRIGFERVVVSGGCFQNRYLTERAVQQLRQAGFRPYWHQRVPPNDGGISLGQLQAFGLGKAYGAGAADRIVEEARG